LHNKVKIVLDVLAQFIKFVALENFGVLIVLLKIYTVFAQFLIISVFPYVAIPIKSIILLFISIILFEEDVCKLIATCSTVFSLAYVVVVILELIKPI